MTTHSISHAVLITAKEADDLLTGRGRSIRRSSATQLRMRVGLLQTDGLLVGSALLVDASPTVAEGQGSNWAFSEFENFMKPKRIPPGEGPLWRRLSSGERNSLSDVEFKDSSDDIKNTNDGSSSNDAFSPLSDCLGKDSAETCLLDENVHQIIPTLETPSALSEEQVQEGEPGTPSLNFTISPNLARADDSDREMAVEPVVNQGLDEVHARAFAFVPDRAIDVQEAYRLLVDLRDTEIKPNYPNVVPQKGILRRAMMQALLGNGVASRDDYDQLIPEELRRATDKRHVDAYLEAILAILSRVA